MDITIQSGENYTKTFETADYLQSDGWAMTFSLRGSGGALDFPITDGTDGNYILSFTAAQTSVLAPGSYAFTAYVEKGDDRYRIESGNAEVLKNYLDEDAYDARSEAEIQLCAVTSVINKTATQNILNYQIAGRSLNRYPLPDLLVLQAKLMRQVDNERRAKRLSAGGSAGLRIRAQF